MAFKTASLILIVLCMAATPPPMPKLRHKSAAVHQGAGAKALIATPPPISGPVTNTIAWQYSPSINPSNYWWNIESSINLKNWSVAISNASGSATITVNKTEPLRIYRLSGRLTP